MARLNTQAIASAIERRVEESFDLDWKESRYSKPLELAKDVAAFANASGGVIIIGVREQGGRAAESTPVELGDEETARLKQIIASNVHPFLDLVIDSVETKPGVGYQVIIVSRSNDAPHAVSDGARLTYPVRDGTTTRLLREAEVAARYRDRFAGRAEIESSLRRVHEEGLARISMPAGPWICVSLVPGSAGHVDGGSLALKAAEGFVQTWARYAPPHSPFQGGNLRAVAGIRRALIVTNNSYQGVSNSPHAELHHSGAGFVGMPVMPVDPEGAAADGETRGQLTAVAQDSLELSILTVISLLAQHAVNVAAYGECEIQAQLVPRMLQIGPPGAVAPVEIYEPETWEGYRGFTTHSRVIGSIRISTATTPARTTAALDDLVVDSYEGVVQAAYGLAVDILGEFGVAEPCVLRSDGLLNIYRLAGKYQPGYAIWAAEAGLEGK